MNGTSTQGQNVASNTPQQSWAKAHEVEQYIGHASQAKKAKIERHLNILWEQIRTQPPDSPDYQKAGKLLQQLTYNLHGEKQSFENLPPDQQQERRRLAAAEDAGTTAPQQQRPSEQQPIQQGSRQQNQAAPEITQNAKDFKYVPHPGIAPGPEQDKWLKENINRHTRAMHNVQGLKQSLDRLDSIIKSRAAEGKPVTQNQLIEIEERKRNFRASLEKERKFITEFRLQQEQWRKGEGALKFQPNNSGGGPGINAGVPQQPSTYQGNAPTPAMSPVTGQAGRPLNVSSESMQIPQHSGAPSVMSPSAPAQDQLKPPQKQQQGLVQGAQPRPQRPPMNLQTASTNQQGSQQTSPQSALPQSAASQNRGPMPLSHQSAMEKAARSYSEIRQTPTTHSGSFSHGHPTSSQHQQPPQHNTQQTPHAPPHIGVGGDRSTPKMPISKTLNIPFPQPVAMPPARPTLSGGSGNVGGGVMGQPAFQKPPQYAVADEAGRVLNKNKLDELVRQVTGGSEGLGGEGVSADVEEVLLQLADDFIDQVTSNACRLAKLRQSSTLEIRDIQLILERNYNIRIPGYASDEIRTVRKIAPAVGWTQKMSAVQAAKVTGGKADV